MSCALLRLNLQGNSMLDQARESAVLSCASHICIPLSPGRLELIVSSLNCDVCSWHRSYKFASESFTQRLGFHVD